MLFFLYSVPRSHFPHLLFIHVHLELEDEVAQEPEYDEEDEEADDVEPEEPVLHAEHLEELDGVAVDAELVLALEGLAVEAVDGEHGALEAVADVGHVAEPLHQVGNVVQGDEEACKKDRIRALRKKYSRYFSLEVA